MNDKCFSMASRGRMDSESIAIAPDHAIDFGIWYGLPLLYGENKRSENEGQLAHSREVLECLFWPARKGRHIKSKGKLRETHSRGHST